MSWGGWNMLNDFIVSVPLRLSLAGGGTDLPEYYLKKNTILLSTAINKRVELMFTKENIHENSELNDLFKKFFPDYNVTIKSEVSPGSGLGGSGAIAVGLVTAKYHILNQIKTPYEIAYEAYQWEREFLKKSVGFQDQFSTAFGGCIEMKAYTDGNIEIIVRDDLKKNLNSLLEKNIIFIETGIKHEANSLLKQLAERINEDGLHKLCPANFMEMENAILTKDICKIGQIIKKHWDNKKMNLPRATNTVIDGLIQKILDRGAIGAKLIGAGGGGYIMVCAYEKDMPQILNIFNDKEYNIEKFQTDSDGVTIRGGK